MIINHLLWLQSA